MHHKKVLAHFKRSKILPGKQKFVYRRAPTLRNYLVHNVIDPPKPVKICSNLKGFYKCRRCLTCRVSKPQPRKKVVFKSTVDQKQYQIKKKQLHVRARTLPTL